MDRDIKNIIIGVSITILGSTLLTLGKSVANYINKRNSKKKFLNNWTNEGDILSKEKMFLHLKLTESKGQIYGGLISTTLEKDLEVHMKFGIFSTKLLISDLRGSKLIPVAEVKIKTLCNNNNLSWKLVKDYKEYSLPKKTTLWLEK